MLAPKVAGITHERDQYVRDGQRPQLETEPKSGRTNSAMPYLNSRLLEIQAKSTLSDTTADPHQCQGNGVQLRWGVPRSLESDHQQNSVCGDLGPSHTCELQSSKGSFWHLTSSNGPADALKNEATIRRVLDTISDLTQRGHEIGLEIQLELLFSLALPDSPSLVSNLCRSDITIDEGQRDGARVKAFGSSYPRSIATNISTYLGSTRWDSDEDEMNRRRELYEAYVQNRKGRGRVRHNAQSPTGTLTCQPGSYLRERNLPHPRKVQRRKG